MLFGCDVMLKGGIILSNMQDITLGSVQLYNSGCQFLHKEFEWLWCFLPVRFFSNKCLQATLRILPGKNYQIHSKQRWELR